MHQSIRTILDALDKEPVDPAFKKGVRQLMETDPRDPDYSRPGIFATHNCYRCRDGKKPCVQGGPHRCEWPIARND